VFEVVVQQAEGDTFQGGGRPDPMARPARGGRDRGGEPSDRQTGVNAV
jgi:hypothetical protein